MTSLSDGLEKLEQIVRPLELQVFDYPFLDFPTAWRIQKERLGLEHHPRCSSMPGWDPISGPHFLCDCGAVQAEFHLMRGEDPTNDRK